MVLSSYGKDVPSYRKNNFFIIVQLFGSSCGSVTNKLTLNLDKVPCQLKKKTMTKESMSIPVDLPHAHYAARFLAWLRRVEYLACPGAQEAA